MIEAVVAVGLIALCAGAVLAGIAAVQHQSTVAQSAGALTFSAQNVLTDLRAATAYDGVLLAALAGRSTAFDVTEPTASGSPQPLRVTVSVAGPDANHLTVASVTVRNARGQSATVQSTLVQEAPAPGSIVPASAPLSDAAADGGGTPSPLPQAACDSGGRDCQSTGNAIRL